MIRPTVVFVRVNGKPEYDAPAQRWLASYRQHRPAVPHDVVVIDRYADGDQSFNDVATMRMRYDGTGWDCGSWQFAGRNIPADLLVCFNSNTRIMGDGWLERIIESVERHGFGLYGPLASLEINPHIRTPCMIFQPEVINGYPAEVTSRPDTYRFEVFGFGDGLVPNFTLWCRSKGYQTRLITWDGCYDLQEWRTPLNIFRRGDQSNCLVLDHHCDAYAVSSDEGKEQLERLADGR